MTGELRKATYSHLPTLTNFLGKEDSSWMLNFSSPELTGPDGYPIGLSGELLRLMVRDMDDLEAAGGNFQPLEGMSEQGKMAILQFEESVRSRAREHARVFDLNGTERYRAIGDSAQVSIDPNVLCGCIATHNHPLSTPPSLQDIVIGAKNQAREIRVCSEQFTYAVRFTCSNPAEIVHEWKLLDALSYGASLEWQHAQAREVSPVEIVRRRLHAALMELARRGLVLYRREINVPF